MAAFTTPERKGHGGGINVYRVDPKSGVWINEQLLEIVNPSFLTLDRAQRFLYSVHADLDEVSAYAIDKQNGHIAALNRQSCGGKNPVHLSIDPTGRWIVTANYSAGSVGVVPIEKDGTLGPRSDLVTLTGEPGPDGKRQTSSHPRHAVGREHRGSRSYQTGGRAAGNCRVHIATSTLNWPEQFDAVTSR
jgi:6-phosphogluconolactonase